MADVLKEYDFDCPGKYPWHKWLDGRIWRVTMGKDFECGRKAFQVAVFFAAKRRGLKVRTSAERPDHVVFQVVGKRGAK